MIFRSIFIFILLILFTITILFILYHEFHKNIDLKFQKIYNLSNQMMKNNK